MQYLDNLLQLAQDNLNDSLRHFESAPTELAREFSELKLQACIFQYDVCNEMVNLLHNQPSGFAASVALKGLVLRLFEYDLATKHLIPRMLQLSEARGISIDSNDIKIQRKQWKTELNQLKSWADVRNRAAGHYDKDLQHQVALLKSLNLEVVMTVTGAFLSFNLYLLDVLKSSGLGSSQDSTPQ
jgi:hypothetical protein